jgi:tricorn protease interacting factor F2/3
MEFVSYDLDLDVDFSRSRVKGIVDIEINEADDPLSLDAVDMQILGVQVNGTDSRFRFDPLGGTLVIPGIPKKASNVRIRFVNQVQDHAINGLYKSKYGKDYFLVTDLEPANARTVFPCRDSPSYKAVFRLRVVTQRDLSVISNTQLVSKEEKPGGRAEFVFEPSPKMSTYLFFLGIGRFEERKKPGTFNVIAASRAGLSKNSEFILGVSSALLKEYGRYFGIPYPLRKLHLVALPEYPSGAMENWGAITSREALVLLEGGASTADLRTAAQVMSHEIAHQWFGNLVTMKWWDDLWLNESFATFMGHKMLERLRPSWDNWRDFLQVHTFRALNADALTGTHPIQANVRVVDEVEGLFDEISYGKGASVLRMIETYVGEEKFREGVSSYLREFSFSNAKGEDLWDSIGRVSRLPVPGIARVWTARPGFPLVRVNVSRGRVSLSQARFSFGRSDGRSVWPIPLTMLVDGKPRSMLLSRRSVSVKCKDPASLVVNPRRTGFYSVLYDANAYDEIAERFAVLHPHDRAGIINDLYLFLQAGMIEPKLFFRFVLLCDRLVDSLTTELIAEKLVNLGAIAGEARIVRDGCSEFYKSQIKELGVTARDGEDESIGQAREVVSIQLATTDARFAHSLSSRFANYEEVEPNLKSCVAVSYAVDNGEPAFDVLTRLVKKEKNETEREKLYRALVSFSDSRLVERGLELSISGEVSRSDSVYTIENASTNPYARATLWKWLTKRYDLLYDTYGGSSRFLRLMNTVIPRCGIGHETEVRRFLSGRRYKRGEIVLRRTLELLGINSALRLRLLAS